VALVQTPQDFYNVTSYEHVELSGGRRFSEQELFYRALAAGRNRWNAAFWCGTNAVVRLAALRDVGGVATETVTEDIHTTIRLHRRGWRTVYHNEVLARGLSAGTSAQFLSQRLRWGTGAMQVLRTENPAFVRGLTAGQRISYLSTLLGWFDSWRTLGFLVLPVATVVTGGLPVAAPLRTFLPVFLLTFGLQRLALRLLARGRSTLWHAILFDAARLPANLRATLTLFSRRTQTFSVTAKGRDSTERGRLPAPRLLVGLLAAHLLAFPWYVATALHVTPLHYGVPWAAHGSAIWLVGNAVVLVAAIRRIRSPLFGPERRVAVRFDVEGDATVDGRTASLRDVSLTGASVVAPLPDAVLGQQVSIVLATAGSVIQLPGVVRSVSALATGPPPAPGGETQVQVGLEFRDMTEDTAARLALALFRTGVAPTVVPAVGYPAAIGIAG
jgi:cellulose synthase (UDP-forming)